MGISESRIIISVSMMLDVGGQSKRRKKVVVLRELHRAIKYTNKMSKQVTQGQVRCSSQCAVGTEVPG
jgi:hypothetical protein